MFLFLFYFRCFTTKCNKSHDKPCFQLFGYYRENRLNNLKLNSTQNTITTRTLRFKENNKCNSKKNNKYGFAKLNTKVGNNLFWEKSKLGYKKGR